MNQSTIRFFTGLFGFLALALAICVGMSFDHPNGLPRYGWLELILAIGSLAVTFWFSADIRKRKRE